MRCFRSALCGSGGRGPETTFVGALQKYSADTARNGFTFAKRRIWIYRSGFKRCFARSGAARSAGCMVSFSPGGGRYANNSGGAGTGVKRENVRFTGAAFRRRGWTVGDKFAGAGNFAKYTFTITERI